MALRFWRGGLVLGLAFVFATAVASAADPQTDEFVQTIVKLIGEHDKEFRAAGLEQVRTAASGARARFAAATRPLQPCRRPIPPAAARLGRPARPCQKA